MKFVFAPDSYKESLKSLECTEILAKAAKDIFPDSKTVSICIADGGEGTVDAILAATTGDRISLNVTGPGWEKITAHYGLTKDSEAVIEMSSASGLSLLPKEKLDPFHTTTYGTGELIMHALDLGIRRFLICLGGSATNDGGMGALTALGVKFLDKDGNTLIGEGASLGKVVKIDITGLDQRIKESEINVLCDVKNPLCGENGATYIYGPQKGATKAMIDRLESGMRSYAKVVEETTGANVSEMPGAGAAGGLGAALYAFCGGKIVSGAEQVLKLVDFDNVISDADLVVTGEGSLDPQSKNGKVVHAVCKHCKENDVKVAAIVGSYRGNIEEYGLFKIYSLMEDGMSLDYSMQNAEALFNERAVQLFKDVKLSQQKDI